MTIPILPAREAADAELVLRVIPMPADTHLGDRISGGWVPPGLMLREVRRPCERRKGVWCWRSSKKSSLANPSDAFLARQNLPCNVNQPALSALFPVAALKFGNELTGKIQ